MTRVYIGKLPYDVRERDIERFVSGYGKVRDILLKNGFGFIEFDDYRDADDAVYELNGKTLLGERVVLEIARGTARTRDDDRFSSRRRGSWMDKYGPPTRTEYRLIVENLSSRVSWQDLKDFMRQAGEVTYADAHRQRKNEGVVEFASYSDMMKAYEKLDDKELNGKRIKLVKEYSRSKRSRSRSRGRGRSRSRSNSRSRSRSKSPRRSSSRRSKSPRRSADRRSRSLSKSPRRTADRRSRSASKSPRRSVDRRSRSGSKSPRRSVDRRSRSRSNSPRRSADRRSRSGSKSPRRSEERRSRSPSREGSVARNGSPSHARFDEGSQE